MNGPLVDFDLTPWQWCSKHSRPEHIDWAMLNCKRSGWYRTREGARLDNR